MLAEHVKWICTYCGIRTMSVKGRRPVPGVCIKKGKTKDGRTKPHSWTRG